MPAVERASNDLNPLRRVLRAADMVSAQSDGRHFFPRPAQCAVDHATGCNERAGAESEANNTQCFSSIHAISWTLSEKER